MDPTCPIFAPARICARPSSFCNLVSSSAAAPRSHAGFIPPRARGQPEGLGALGPDVRVHPRACGAASPRPTSILRSARSSPRVRGGYTDPPELHVLDGWPPHARGTRAGSCPVRQNSQSTVLLSRGSVAGCAAWSHSDQREYGVVAGPGGGRPHVSQSSVVFTPLITRSIAVRISSSGCLPVGACSRERRTGPR